jgi:hypothetical protein
MLVLFVYANTWNLYNLIDVTDYTPGRVAVWNKGVVENSYTEAFEYDSASGKAFLCGEQSGTVYMSRVKFDTAYPYSTVSYSKFPAPTGTYNICGGAYVNSGGATAGILYFDTTGLTVNLLTLTSYGGGLANWSRKTVSGHSSSMSMMARTNVYSSPHWYFMQSDTSVGM